MNLSLKVRRDYSRPDFPHFLVATDEGPATPEDYVCAHVARLGWRPALRTQNDCWEVLAGTIAGCLVPVAPCENGFYMVRGFAARWPAAEYAAFQQGAAKALRRSGALVGAWRTYARTTLTTRAGRQLLETRGETIEAFMTQLVPCFDGRQVLGIADLVYRGGTANGMPDVAFARGGVAGFIEVKAPEDSLRDHQQAMHEYLSSQLGIGVWLCELHDIGDSDSPEAAVFKRARAEARPQTTSVRPAEDASREPMAQDIPRIGACDSERLIAFTRGVMERQPDLAPYILRVNIPKLTDSEVDPAFLPFLDAVLSEKERDQWLPELNSAYEERLAVNAAPPEPAPAAWPLVQPRDATREATDKASDAFREAWKREGEEPEKAVSEYRRSLATYVAALGGPEAEWLPSHILFMFNRLTLVLERLGRHAEALGELEACTALSLPAQGPRSVLESMTTRERRLRQSLQKGTQ